MVTVRHWQMVSSSWCYPGINNLPIDRRDTNFNMTIYHSLTHSLTHSLSLSLSFCLSLSLSISLSIALTIYHIYQYLSLFISIFEGNSTNRGSIVKRDPSTAFASGFQATNLRWLQTCQAEARLKWIQISTILLSYCISLYISLNDLNIIS